MSEISSEDLGRMAKRFVDGQSTMTLSTGRGGAVWAAPLFYVHMDSSFYFLSSPDSRHIKESLEPCRSEAETCRAAAAISVDTFDWRKIKGIQMSGRVGLVSPGREAARALGEYLRKFSFAGDFFGVELPDLMGFRERFGVRFYRFRPETVYYLDNSIRFGFRETVWADGSTLKEPGGAAPEPEGMHFS